MRHVSFLVAGLAGILAGCGQTATPTASTPKGIREAVQSVVPQDDAIGDLLVDEPIRHANLTIFPVSSRTSKTANRFITLDAGIKSGKVEIMELGTHLATAPSSAGRSEPKPAIPAPAPADPFGAPVVQAAAAPAELNALLLDHGAAGMRAVMDQVFPETSDEIGARSAKIASLVEQLGDDSFERREEADAALRRLGSSCVGVLHQSIGHKDPEIRFRIRKLIEVLARESTRESEGTNQALRAYLNKVEDLECRQELARRVTKALEARLDITPKQEALKISLEAMTRWPTNRVHNELLPLLKLENPAPAVFAMRAISGRTGNNYVSAIHMGAIASERPELVKCGFRSMPGPIWDKENWPKIKESLERLFDDSKKEQAELRGDAEFMFQSAFVAARDFKIAKARQWLIAKIKKGNEEESLRAMGRLSDYYMREPLDPELLAALEPHLKSKEPKFRAAAVGTLGVYRGEAVHALLLKAFADPVKEVWQVARESLKRQHSYCKKGSSPIPKLLESALQANEGPEHRARLDLLLMYLEQR